MHDCLAAGLPHAPDALSESLFFAYQLTSISVLELNQEVSTFPLQSHVSNRTFQNFASHLPQQPEEYCRDISSSWIQDIVFLSLSS